MYWDWNTRLIFGIRRRCLRCYCRWQRNNQIKSKNFQLWANGQIKEDGIKKNAVWFVRTSKLNECVNHYEAKTRLVSEKNVFGPRKVVCFFAFSLSVSPCTVHASEHIVLCRRSRMCIYVCVCRSFFLSFFSVSVSFVSSVCVCVCARVLLLLFVVCRRRRCFFSMSLCSSCLLLANVCLSMCVQSETEKKSTTCRVWVWVSVVLKSFYEQNTSRAEKNPNTLTQWTWWESEQPASERLTFTIV